MCNRYTASFCSWFSLPVRHAFFLSLLPNSLTAFGVSEHIMLLVGYSDMTSNTVCDVQANQSVQKKKTTAVRCRCCVCARETTQHNFLLLSKPEGVNDPEGHEKGAHCRIQYPRNITFRCRAEINSRVAWVTQTMENLMLIRL